LKQLYSRKALKCTSLYFWLDVKIERYRTCSHTFHHLLRLEAILRWKPRGSVSCRLGKFTLQFLLSVQPLCYTCNYSLNGWITT
jgi:hypothetical protein